MNIGDGPLRGRYKDFKGTGKTVNLFDFAATIAGRFGGDWFEALKHYARIAGVSLPEGREELAADRLELFEPTVGMLTLYASRKPGVRAPAIQQLGGMGARWPKGLPAEKTNHLIAFPMYGSALLDLEPIGWHVVAANPAVKIRKYQGKDKQEQLVKTLTIGECGLMNVDGLNRLADAKVVNITEGVTDLLAGQSLQPPDGHVFISAGASSYHPKAEWMQHFSGKDVRIWFDVGDGDDAGQVAAAVWVTAMLPVAAAVRNVKLPLGKDGGKNDLRAWIVEGSRTYADLCTYAETFEPVQSSDAEAQVSVHDAILHSLGLLVIGEHEGTQKVEVFSERTKKSGTITDIDKLSVAKLIQFLGAEVVEEFVHDGKEAQPGKYQLKDVKNAIAAAASDKLFHGDEHLGSGVWEVEDHVVLVKSLEAGVLNGDYRVQQLHVPYFHGRVLDLSRASSDWFEVGQMSRTMAETAKIDYCWSVIHEAEALFAKWFWKYSRTPELIASLVPCTWLQTIWEWRPLVAITGGSDTGKSLIMEDVLPRLFGKLGFYALKPTEAAIRQHVHHHAKAILLDEFEADQHRAKILELFRTSSRGGSVIRGTADQRGAKFSLRHIPWVAAIELGLHRQADKNRFIVLELENIPPDRRGKITLPTPGQLSSLGIKLLCVGLRHYRRARELSGMLRGHQIDGVPGRVVESFSVPLGLRYALEGFDNTEACAQMTRFLADWDFGGQQSRDEFDLLHEIFTSEVLLEGGHRMTVSQLLNRDTRPMGADQALARVGIRRCGDDEERLFVCHRTVKKHFFRFGAEFHGQSIDQYLLRLEGAMRDRQRLGGKESLRGVSVPMTTIAKVFQDAIDTPTQSDEGNGYN
ncbi:MAG TPA: hypothetical protein VG713_10420 [Pirellulales bacterium]|nr:hypothetical protein [Pirellulales bacterium]